jgi:hypothetical protein
MSVWRPAQSAAHTNGERSTIGASVGCAADRGTPEDGKRGGIEQTASQADSSGQQNGSIIIRKQSRTKDRRKPQRTSVEPRQTGFKTPAETVV